MNLKMWQVDAFSDKPFGGNPAAIVPLERWLDDALMQRIANENNLAETAFFVATAPGRYRLRWFTPESEVELCGHATLASAWLLFEQLAPGLNRIDFDTLSGVLTVARGTDGRHVMSMPSTASAEFDVPGLNRKIAAALGAPEPATVLKSRYLVGVWDDAKAVRALKGPGDIAHVTREFDLWGFIATAPGDVGYDFVSRFFAPDKGVPEDPVTGSAHCILSPYWAKRLGKTSLKARQVSPRGGDVDCTDAGDRTVLSGPCALYMTAEIFV
ncbi:MAG: PhzF family phenazine biosynthesis protein [Proteobacteria bacterium]|nr:PhzF family phenazine biosynthesis protein [Pseudomonadota bacterium]